MSASVIDLRSDTVSRPSDAMRAAMAAAEVGDDVFGDDPTVARLEERAAATMGKAAGLFVPSGTMANLVSILTHTKPGDEIIVGGQNHIFQYELAGVAPGEVEVGVHERSVTVRGRRRDVRIEDNQQSYCMEISYNQFERTVNLPCDLSLMDARVDYRDGMLLVQLICREGEA